MGGHPRNSARNSRSPFRLSSIHSVSQLRFPANHSRPPEGSHFTGERFGFVPRAFFSPRLPNSVTYGIFRAFPFRPSSGRSYCKPELIGHKRFPPHLWVRRRARVEEPFRSAPPEGRLAPSLGGVRVRWDRFGRPFPERVSLP